MTENTRQVKTKWGDTEAYAQFKLKSAGRAAAEEKETVNKMMEIFAQIGALKQQAHDSPQVQAKIAELRQFITKNYYDCNLQIFASLGQMYAAEGEMKDNIDKAGGAGTADFAAKAVEIYCRQAQ